MTAILMPTVLPTRFVGFFVMTAVQIEVELEKSEKVRRNLEEQLSALKNKVCTFARIHARTDLNRSQPVHTLDLRARNTQDEVHHMLRASGDNQPDNGFSQSGSLIHHTLPDLQRCTVALV